MKVIVKSLKNNKAPREDNINPKLLKFAGRDLSENLHKTISMESIERRKTRE